MGRVVAAAAGAAYLVRWQRRPFATLETGA